MKGNYNQDAVISVGYRANSVRATLFRLWRTYVLRQFAIRGYAIDKKRMENGTFIDAYYFEHPLADMSSKVPIDFDPSGYRIPIGLTFVYNRQV